MQHIINYFSWKFKTAPCKNVSFIRVIFSCFAICLVRLLDLGHRAITVYACLLCESLFP